MAREASGFGSGQGGVRDTKLYDDLGIPPTASAGEVRSAYYKLAKVHHPDRNPDAAPEAFHAIQTAYEILSDDNRRAEYDEVGMSAVDGNRSRWDYDDDEDYESGPSFADFFDTGSRTRQKRTKKGGKSPDSHMQYEVTLEDLFKGRKVTMEVEKERCCATCNGSGLRPKSKSSPCPRCRGSGEIVVVKPMSAGMLAQVAVDCPNCEGVGQKIKSKDACKKCRGMRTSKQKTKVEWWIEKGMLPDDVVTLSDEGDSLPECKPGDLHLRLVLTHNQSFSMLAPHSRDLQLTVTITLSETLLGLDRLLFTHLDGRGIRACLPGPQEANYKVIRPGDTMKIVGEGLPGGRKGADGDLWIKWEVAWPTEAWVKSRDPAVWKALESNLPPKRKDLPGTTEDQVEDIILVRGDLEKAKAAADKREAALQAEQEDDMHGGPQCPAS